MDHFFLLLSQTQGANIYPCTLNKYVYVFNTFSNLQKSRKSEKGLQRSPEIVFCCKKHSLETFWGPFQICEIFANLKRSMRFIKIRRDPKMLPKGATRPRATRQGHNFNLSPNSIYVRILISNWNSNLFQRLTVYTALIIIIIMTIICELSATRSGGI